MRTTVRPIIRRYGDALPLTDIVSALSGAELRTQTQEVTTEGLGDCDLNSPPEMVTSRWKRGNHRVPRVLFVSHEASRTGSVLALLRQAQWLVDECLVDPRFLIRTPGGLFDADLLEQFEALGPTRMVSLRSERLRRAMRNRLGLRVSHALDVLFALRTWIEYREVSLVWFNTAMNGPVHFDLSLLRAPRVCHIHELRRFLNAFLPPHWMTAALDDVDIWAAVGEDVAKMLESDYQVSPDRIEILPGIAVIDHRAVLGRDQEVHTQSSSALSEALIDGVGAKFKVAAIGPPGTRKGSDMFVATAIELARKGYGSRIAMTWLGGTEGTIDFEDLAEDVRAAGLSEMVEVRPSRPDMAAFYSELDLLLIPSRQESFPLVMLEAALFGVPLLTFQGSGGSDAFASWGAGRRVPYLDSTAMAAEIVALVEDRGELGRLGEAARVLVTERFGIDAIGGRCKEIFERSVRLPTRPLLGRVTRLLRSQRPA